MSTPDDPYASPSGEQPARPDDQPGSGGAAPGQPAYGQPAPTPNPNPGYGEGFGPQPGYAAGGQPPGAQQPGAQAPFGTPSPQGFGPPYGQQPYGQQQQYGQAPYGWQPPPRTNGLAIAALVCSVAAFAVCISAPVGVVLGFVALSQIKRTGEQGRGLALAGIWIGAIFTALALIGLAVLIAFGVWFADDVGDACPRSEFASEQAYEDCLERELDDRFNTSDDGFQSTTFRTT